MVKKQGLFSMRDKRKEILEHLSFTVKTIAAAETEKGRVLQTYTSEELLAFKNQSLKHEKTFRALLPKLYETLKLYGIIHQTGGNIVKQWLAETAEIE